LRAFPRLPFDPDPLLGRLERTAVALCLVAAGAGVLLHSTRLALSILGGGLLSATSYWAIRASVTALLAAAARSAEKDPSDDNESVADTAEGPEEGAAENTGGYPVLLAGVVTRYGLLGLMAYAMIARLRLDPLGLLIGLSAIFVAASVEAARAAAGVGRIRPRG